MISNCRYSIILLVALSSCLLKSDNKVDLRDFMFKTTDSSELFFKNVRQSYYELEERQLAKMNVFRWKETSRDSFKIRPIIIHNWLRDEAYLWLEVDENLMKDTLLLKIVGEKNAFELNFSNQSKEDNFEMANSIFNGILDNAELSLGETTILEKNTPARTAFKLVMNDYFRLVSLK